MTTPTPIAEVLTEVEAFLKRFRTPAGAVTALILILGVAGGTGILSTQWTGALKILLEAILGVIAVATHQVATAALVRRAARKSAARTVPIA